MTIKTHNITQTGCYLDNHRGHFITRDVIELAQGYGFLVDEFAQWAIDWYDDHNTDASYPIEALQDLAMDAMEWLNAGQSKRRPGQNFPPIIPEDCYWDYNDGDFGLYKCDEDGEIIND